MTDSSAGITEEMIEKAAIASFNMLKSGPYERTEFDALPEAHRTGWLASARTGLEAALAGRTVLELPAPDGEDSDGDPSWSLATKGGEVVAYLEEGTQPHVTVFDLRGSEGAPADRVEAYGIVMIAAAREARRLAAVSSKGGDPSHE